METRLLKHRKQHLELLMNISLLSPGRTYELSYGIKPFNLYEVVENINANFINFLAKKNTSKTLVLSPEVKFIEAVEPFDPEKPRMVRRLFTNKEIENYIATFSNEYVLERL